jgi:hypothetical protein
VRMNIAVLMTYIKAQMSHKRQSLNFKYVDMSSFEIDVSFGFYY